MMTPSGRPSLFTLSLPLEAFLSAQQALCSLTATCEQLAHTQGRHTPSLACMLPACEGTHGFAPHARVSEQALHACKAGPNALAMNLEHIYEPLVVHNGLEHTDVAELLTPRARRLATRGAGDSEQFSCYNIWITSSQITSMCSARLSWLSIRTTRETSLKTSALASY